MHNAQRRDWFAPTPSAIDILRDEITIEQTLREIAEAKLREETAARLDAERERDAFRVRHTIAHVVSLMHYTAGSDIV
jgi:hypothetical protein